MGSSSQNFSVGSPPPLIYHSGEDDIADHMEAECLVCSRVFVLEVGMDEALYICEECKIIFNNYQTSSPISGIRRRTRRRSRATFGNSRPVVDFFSRQFSRLISLARHNQEAEIESDIPATRRRHAVGLGTSSRLRRHQWASSDNESENLDQSEFAYGDIDSNISLGGYGAEWDVASLDRRSSLDREISFQHDDESNIDTDTDIDPMRAGLWNSDDQEDADEESEEVDFDETTATDAYEPFRDGSVSPGFFSWMDSPDVSWIHWRIEGNQPIEMEELHLTPLDRFGNPEDYVDGRGLEDLLDHLAEVDGSRRGAPPAAVSFVMNLPCVVISKHDLKNGTLMCAVCKDPMPVATEAIRLPCVHLYHTSCILPWLAARNSCPVCRYELPTDDPDYEESKRNTARASSQDHRQLVRVEETDDTSSEGGAEVVEPTPSISNRVGGSGGWLFLATAPIVSIVGMATVFWLIRPRGDRWINEQQLLRSRSSSSPADRSRRWWTFS